MSKRRRLTIWITEEERLFLSRIGESEQLSPAQVLHQIVKVLGQTRAFRLETLSKLSQSTQK